MPIRRVILVLIVLLGLVLLTAAPQAQAQQRIHIVQPGETLSRIALRYGVTVQQIAAANGIVNPSLIYVGQRLVIPGTEPPPPSGNTTTYTVQRGDNLTRIAGRFNTTVAVLIQLNGLTNPNLLYVGQVLIVPAPDGQPAPTATPTQGQPSQPTATQAAPTATPAPEQVTHVVQRGETLSGIAVRYGTTVQQLVLHNKRSNPSLIYPGQVLIIRRGPAPPATPAPPTATSAPGTATSAPPTAVPGRVTHTVQRGETLSGIAVRYGVTVQRLVLLNNLSNPNLIYPGQVLIIHPGPTPTATSVPPTATIAPTSTRDPNVTPTAGPTPLPGGIPTPTPIVRTGTVPQDAENLLANPGFEGSTRQVGSSIVRVFEGWEPFYCAQPYTAAPCPAARQGAGNPSNLLMGRPEYDSISTANRVHGGSTAQHWACRYITCRAGVYQTVETNPGDLCEAGAFVQSLSTHSANLVSDLALGSDRENSTWRIKVDLNGGDDAFAEGSNMLLSPGFSYNQGVYDRYAHVSYVFNATGPRTTVFFEDFRLWPFMRNISYLDDAYVRCVTP